MEYDFTLKFKLATDDIDADLLVERLGEAGCDDALVGVGHPGRIALDFTREAESAEAAIVSALADVKKAIPDAKLVEVSPDFVGLSDVAELIGVTRQNMRKLMLAHAESFPMPLHEGSAAVWHLATVLKWLKERGTYHFEQTVFDVAYTAMQVNIAKEVSSLTPRVRREVRAFVA
ncbi:MAG: DNA-binding protein [Casimicrobiaceae bacterium]